MDLPPPLPWEKSIAIYFPSHIYPLQSLTISFPPWATNYREKPTTSWAVICGAVDPHPLDLLSRFPSETAGLSPINSSMYFFFPLVNVTPLPSFLPLPSYFLSTFFSLLPLPLLAPFLHSHSPIAVYTLPPQWGGRWAGWKGGWVGGWEAILNNKINFLSALNWLIIQRERLTAAWLQKIKSNTWGLCVPSPCLSGNAAVKLILNYQSTHRLSCTISLKKYTAEQKSGSTGLCHMTQESLFLSN